MFAILARAENAAPEPEFAAVREACLRRGRDKIETWAADGSRIGVCRYAWELDPDFADGVLVHADGQLVVVADASLYYRDDLIIALRSAGVEPTGRSPSHLIAAAYRAWGPAGVARLEGDFAFVLWDRREQRLIGARDLHGSRPLFFAPAGDHLVVASCLSAVAAHPGMSRDLNLLAIAEDLCSLSSVVVEDTAFRAIRRVPAGCLVQWQPCSTPQLRRFAEAPLFEQGDDADAEEAAARLRAVLGRAARERLAIAGRTSVWMSGGYDSPSVFALARTGRGAGQEVLPVSMSYPVGDRGREDELIQAVADHHGVPVTWVSRADIPPLPDPTEWAERRDDAIAHPYECWNLALVAGTRRLGSHIALNGNGGDQFFGASGIFLGDLLRRGHLIALFRELRALGLRLRGLRELFHWAVKPNLPRPLVRMVTRLRRGKRLRQHLQRAIPEWLAADPGFVADLYDRQWDFHRRRPGESFASAEASWYLHTGAGQRIISTLGAFALANGVESRSPMYDPRVLAMMARRPREDRYAHAENKRLLRRAMQGLLPAEHLAPRRNRTGLPGGYLAEVLPRALPAWLERLGGHLLLADVGLVNPVALRRTLDRYLRNPPWENQAGAEVFDVLSTEFWLRSRTGAVA